MEPEGSLLCLQETATGPYSESVESSPYLSILFLEDQLQYYHPIYTFVSREVSFLYVFATKLLHALLISSIHATCSSNPIIFELIPVITSGEA